METVKDVLDVKGRKVWSIDPDCEIHSALVLMKEKKIGALTVVDEDGKLTGIFSERDLVSYCAGRENVSLHNHISELMKNKVVCISENQSIEDCMAVMTEKKIRHLPVVENGKVLGMISIGDVVKASIHAKEFMIDQLAHYITGSL